MKQVFSVIFIVFIFPGLLFAQSPYTNIQISNTGGPNEVSICINPKNPNQLVAGANIDNYYYSNNGGTSWTQGTLVSSLQVWGDPIISVDTTGNFYYFHLVNGQSFIDRMGCQKSTNAGVSWSDGTFYQFNPPKQQDKEGVSVDFTHGSRGNTIYVTWTQFDSYGTSNPNDSSIILFAKSTDAGASFGSIKRINQKAGNCVDNGYTMEGAVPCVGPNGEVYVAWSGALSAGNFKIFFDKSTDGGNTWLPNNIIAGNQPGGWDYTVPGIYRNNGLACTLCDISNGPYRGNIYINYTDSAGPGDHDVKIIKSTNGGLNWSSPIRVNDDPPGKEQFFSWMAIDQVTGFIYTVFYDRRNYTNAQTDVYMAHSTDGGNTWINERISSSPFTPNSSTFFGDYNGISAYNGKIRPMWTRLNGSLSVWTAIIDFPVGIQPVSNETPSSFSLSQNYPNPFNPSTKIRFAIGSNKNTPVRLVVYDVLGKETATLVNNTLSPGNYEIQWDASQFASGVYYYSLITDSYKETRKLILAK
jgi:hypothetical protein